MDPGESVATVGNDPGTGGSLAETFVVRLFVPLEPDHGADDDLHGVVEEVGSENHQSFTGGTELLSFLAAARAHHEAEGASGRPG